MQIMTKLFFICKTEISTQHLFYFLTHNFFCFCNLHTSLWLFYLYSAYKIPIKTIFSTHTHTRTCLLHSPFVVIFKYSRYQIPLLHFFQNMQLSIGFLPIILRHLFHQLIQFGRFWTDNL